eukprot:TRINITY_DN59799_c0_g1_i2.p1 TRINITY_DN59799_c0_g1~~TRINITY_DN59799_c0_g1_i2.p1  ORF type:complete len:247 (-),score=112.68 TRINITY_DN59799_c0_g1_i2:74-814(-)
MYFSFAGFNWFFLFDKKALDHPKVLPNQVRREIWCFFKSVPGGSALTTAVFVAEIRGHSRLYDDLREMNLQKYTGVDDGGWLYIGLSFFAFLFFTDMGIYWIHRWLHTFPLLYKYIHKPHHTWLITSPWASHAFHWADGFLQSVPYHLFVFLFPFHKVFYLVMYIFVNVWTVSIHDHNYFVSESMEDYINGAAHHNGHHVYFLYNYGQYFTLWDRLMGTHKDPRKYPDEKIRSHFEPDNKQSKKQQ